MSLKGLKAIFMGTPAFSIPALKALINSECDILAVVTQPDRPVGRGRKISFNPIKELALENNLKTFQPLKVSDGDFIEEMREMKADIFVVVAFGQILPKALIDIPPMGAINIHASLLPAYRGAAPINWAIVKGEKATGVTTMLIDEGLDSGDMLLKSEIIVGNDDAATLYDKLAKEGARLLIKTIEGLKNKSIKREKQDDALASYAPMLKKEDGLIDWNADAEVIINKVRGLLPWPTAHTAINGRSLKIFKARKKDGRGKAGTVIIVTKDHFEVAAGSGSVEITELQLEGKKRMSSGDFLRGVQIRVGDKLGQ
ncbi:MAG: methionyl-tRNA formyltransferase [Deltaproteobacteria bacterium]|nr:methionyl-tRNA formyltransferase [Deltaproteobacteria bacterium]